MHSTYSINLDFRVAAMAQISQQTLELTSLQVEPAFRRQGLGRRLMKLVCDDADREGVELCLMAAGSSDALSTVQLEAWYRRFGFVGPNDRQMMVRKPRVKKFLTPVAGQR